MAISEPYSSTGLTVSTTELSIVSGTSTLQNVTDDGIYQCFLDLNALVAGDAFDFSIYEKVAAASTKRKAFIASFAHAQGADNAVWISPSLVLLHGWDMTLIRTAGVDRAIGYSIRKIA